MAKLECLNSIKKVINAHQKADTYYMHILKRTNPFILMLLVFLTPPFVFSASCTTYSILFIGRSDYAVKENGKIVFKSQYAEVPSTWNARLGEYRKIYLAFNKNSFTDLKKAKFESEFETSKKIVIKKTAAILPPLKDTYHEIEKLNFYSDILDSLKLGQGKLKIKFIYDHQLVCEQEYQIESSK